MASVINLIAHINANLTGGGPIYPATGVQIRPIFAIAFKELTNTTQVPSLIPKLIWTISKSTKPYDMAVVKNTINDETVGAMRQIHSNIGPTWLPPNPKTATTQLSHRAALYDAYCQQNKAQNTQNGGGNVTTGYIEYTASDNDTYSPAAPLRSRIVYDYINDRVFFSPQHYQSWTIAGTVITTVSGNDVTAMTPAHPSAFYFVTDIPGFYAG